MRTSALSSPGLYPRRPHGTLGRRLVRAARVGLAILEQVLRQEKGELDALHRPPEPGGDPSEEFRIVEMERGLNYGPGDLHRFLRLEDPAPDEDAVDSQLAAERRIGRGRDPPRCEIHDGESAEVADLMDQLLRNALL